MNILLKVFTLLGGLAFFLYGMKVMSDGLSKLAGGSLERALKKTTSNVLMAMGLGAGITIAIQSSSAMTVMLVGLVNSGIMTLRQTIGVIMGSNIGTTLTPWIFSLSGVEGDGLISLLKPANFSPLVAFIGILLTMMGKTERKKDIGKILIGFAVLMFGMTLMGDSMEGLEDSDIFERVIGVFEKPVTGPILGVLFGAVFTGIIQSSAASVSMLQNLALTGAVSYGVAIPIIMGQNIGTCVTALISSIGVSKNAKKVSVVHISFNLIGTAVCLILFFGVDAIFGLPFMDNSIDAFGIALCHTIFNVVTTALLAPFVNMLENIANKLIRIENKAEALQGAFLDERLLKTPSVAVAEANNRTGEMARIAGTSIANALDLLDKYSEKAAQTVMEQEDELDKFEDKLGDFLARLSARSLSEKDSREISKLLHTIGDFERLGDHAAQVGKCAQEIYEKKITFSEKAVEEINTMTAAIREIVDLTTHAFVDHDLALAQRVEPLEQVVDILAARSKKNHIERVQNGKCTIQMGFVLSDLLANYKRISDHCSNIAVAVIESEEGSFDAHQYLNEVKESGSHNFGKYHQEYLTKYGV